MDPHKVRAVSEMPFPKDVAAIQHLLGLTQYLSKFFPNLSDITKPLRECIQNDSECISDHSQQDVLETLKKADTSTHVLRYYNTQEGVTLQVMHHNPVWVQL